jgi:regulator of replication initiation timing
MADRQLRRLKREELLQMLLELEQENEQLAQENRRLREQLAQREVCIAEAGSLAEAALKLSGVFEAAQRAADLYVENVRRMAQGSVEEGGDEWQ